MRRRSPSNSRWTTRAGVLTLVIGPVVAFAAPASATPTNTPSLTLQAGGSSTAGAGVSATATLSGTINSAVGSITFSLYGPGDSSCAGTPITTARSVAGDNSYTSSSYPNQAGSYYWTATYSGDASNNPTATVCDAAGSTVEVAKATPDLGNQASEAVTLGAQIFDVAQLSDGASSPSGSITFDAYGPNDASCAGPHAFEIVTDIVSGGNYQSTSVTPVAAGTYRWVASYSGDANNNAVATSCSDALDSVLVRRADSHPVISVSPDQVMYGAETPETINVSVSTFDSGPVPTGTVSVRDGSLPICSVVLAAGSGSCTLTATQLPAASYLLVASYPGDSNSAPATSAQTSMVVQQASTAVTLALSRTTVRFGKEGKEQLSVKVSSSPTGSAPTGKVTIKSGGHAVCTITLHAHGRGACRPTKKTLSVGRHSLVAHYAGTTNLSSAKSPKKTVTVKK